MVGFRPVMKPKLWQIVVIVAGLLVGTGSVVYALVSGNRSPVKNVIHCVDVETGTVYRINMSSTRVILPARHPETGRICLVRVGQDENGKWHVKDRDLGMLSMLDPDVKNTAVDAESGAIKAEVKNPVPYVPKR